MTLTEVIITICMFSIALDIYKISKTLFDIKFDMQEMHKKIR